MLFIVAVTKIFEGGTSPLAPLNLPLIATYYGSPNLTVQIPNKCTLAESVTYIQLYSQHPNLAGVARSHCLDVVLTNTGYKAKHVLSILETIARTSHVDLCRSIYTRGYDSIARQCCSGITYVVGIQLLNADRIETKVWLMKRAFVATTSQLAVRLSHVTLY